MHVFYLTVDRFHEYQADLPPGNKNPGGGIADKTLFVLDAWRCFYDVGVGENIEDSFDAEILVVEPLWFRLRGGLTGLLEAPNLEEAVTAYEQHPAKTKVVYCSEFGFIKLPKEFRDRIIEASSVVTTNCDYQENIFRMFDIETERLCDPIDESIFHTEGPKALSVMAMGKIGPDKNSEKVIEIFRKLGEYDVQRIYIGDASLWGPAGRLGKRLQREMQSVVDVYYPNLAQKPLSDAIAPIACGVMDTFHDSCAASNIIMCMGGVMCFYGLHGTWEGRPGVGGLDTVGDFVAAIHDATDGFKEIPAPAHFQAARDWAVNNYSQQQFLKEWGGIRKNVA